MSELNLELELLSHDLIEVSKKASTKRIAYFDEAFSKLKKGNKESLDAMKIIEKSFQEEEHQEKQSFLELQDKIKEIENNLKSGLDNYYANYSIDKETKKLEESKDKGTQPKMMIYRKETHDANFKYDRILKEEKDTLREHQDAYDDYVKQFKAKILDLEKRCRLEVNKEKAQNLALYEDLQKKLLETNNRKEIKDLNKQIQDIQKVGLKNETNIKLNYQELIKNEKLNFEENKKNLLIEINNIEKDYKLKKLEIETEKKHINLRFQIELDKYDFGSKRAINNLNQKMIAKKNSLIMSYKSNKKDVVNEAKAKQIEKIKYKESITNDFVNVMESNYNAYNETLKLGTNLIKDVYVQDLDKYTIYLENIFKNLCSMIISLHEEYINTSINIEYENIKLIINAKYNYDTLNKKSYEEFINKLNTLYDTFKENMNSSLQKHIEKIESLFQNANSYIENMISSIKESLAKDDILVSFHEELAHILSDEINNTKVFEKDAYEKELISFEFIDSQIKDYNDTNAMCDEENKNINAEHSKKDLQIDEEVNNYYALKDSESKKIDEDLSEEINNICESYNLKEQEFENNYNIAISSAISEKENNVKQIELDFKTAMNLLK